MASDDTTWYDEPDGYHQGCGGAVDWDQLKMYWECEDCGKVPENEVTDESV